MKLKDNYTYFYIKNYNINDILLKLKKENINIYEVTKNGYIKISSKDFDYFKSTYFYLDIIKVSYTGINYLFFFLKKYYLALIELMICIGIIFFCSFLIVDINVETTDESLKKLLVEELEKNNIAKFSLKKSYQEIQRIKEKIKNANLDTIEWLELENKGMKYIVHVEKRVINVPKTENSYCHIYAGKDGLISKIKMFRGQTDLLINDYVKKGDLLINGDITKDDEIVHHVCASGKVYAQVWYTVNIKVPMNYTHNEKTGKKRINFIINYDGVDHQIFKDRLKDFISEKKEILNVLGVKLSLKTDWQIKKEKYVYTESEAINKAITDAEKSVYNKLKKGESIVSEKVLQKELIDSTMNVDVFIVAEEEIGELKIIDEVENDIQFNKE